MSHPSRAKKLTFTFGIVSTLLLASCMVLYRLALARAYVSFSRAEEPASAPYEQHTSLARLERGEALINTLGCRDCHGAQLRGGIVAEVPQAYRVVAPDLLGPTNDDTAVWRQQWRALRLGLDGDKRALWAMPRAALLSLAQEDVAALCDALAARRRAERAQAHGPTPWPTSYVRVRGYIALLRGDLNLVDTTTPAPPPDGWPKRAPDGTDVAALSRYETQLRQRKRASRIGTAASPAATGEDLHPAGG